MSNRTDYANVARSLRRRYGLSENARARIEAELHNAHVAGQEGSPCGCSSCDRASVRPVRSAPTKSQLLAAVNKRHAQKQAAEKRHAERHGHR